MPMTQSPRSKVMTKRIGIIGNGNVGSELARGLPRAGHGVRAAGKDPVAVSAVADWAKIVILAVPFGAIEETLREIGNAVEGKVLVDVTNALGPQMDLVMGFTTSCAEE